MTAVPETGQYGTTAAPPALQPTRSSTSLSEFPDATAIEVSGQRAFVGQVEGDMLDPSLATLGSSGDGHDGRSSAVEDVEADDLGYGGLANTVPLYGFDYRWFARRLSAYRKSLLLAASTLLGSMIAGAFALGDLSVFFRTGSSTLHPYLSIFITLGSLALLAVASLSAVVSTSRISSMATNLRSRFEWGA